MRVSRHSSRVAAADVTVLVEDYHRDVAVAQQRADIVFITRIFTGSDGRTHAEEIDVKLAPGGVCSPNYRKWLSRGMQFRRQARRSPFPELTV